MFLKYLTTTLLMSAFLVTLGCDPTQQPDNDPTPGAIRYVFSRDGESTVSKSGQMMRQLLILGLKHHIGTLTDRIDIESEEMAAGKIKEELLFFYDYDSIAGEGVTHPVLNDTDDTTPPALQATYNDISTKNLKDKIAGNDTTGQYKEWVTEFIGFTLNNSPTTPEELVLHWFDTLDSLAVDRANGTLPQDPSGAAITHVFVTAQGLDLQQLLQKFLMGAVSFSQAADDYLDYDIDGKGLNTSNAPDEGKPYSALEHSWDEGFGYFGAAIDYSAYSDDEIAGKGGRNEWSKGYHDSDKDGKIDLTREMNFGHSQNAAKRDRGNSGTDLTKEAFDAFLAGRQIIHDANQEVLPVEQLTALRAEADKAVLAWEKAIGATVIHYIKDVLGDMNAVDYDFYGHAKHWSELKGFALSLQFNPRSPLTSDQFIQLHATIGEKPVLPEQDGFDAYKTSLQEASDLLQTAYEFTDANIAAW